MTDASEAERLIERVRRGDSSALGELLQLYRARLRRMVSVRLDPRLAARVDASDVVQETLAMADRRLPEYLRDRPMAFYPWLRRLAADRLADLRRKHILAGNRAVTREEPQGLPDDSVRQLAERLVARGSSPSRNAERAERRARVRVALGLLPEKYREVLVLRHLEQLESAEIAAIVGVTEATVHTRHLRALRRLQALLGPDFAEGES